MPGGDGTGRLGRGKNCDDIAIGDRAGRGRGRRGRGLGLRRRRRNRRAFSQRETA